MRTRARHRLHRTLPSGPPPHPSRGKVRLVWHFAQGRTLGCSWVMGIATHSVQQLDFYW